jgi:hypothetical protein
VALYAVQEGGRAPAPHALAGGIGEEGVRVAGCARTGGLQAFAGSHEGGDLFSALGRPGRCRDRVEMGVLGHAQRLGWG